MIYEQRNKQYSVTTTVFTAGHWHGASEHTRAVAEGEQLQSDQLSTVALNLEAVYFIMIKSI